MQIRTTFFELAVSSFRSMPFQSHYRYNFTFPHSYPINDNSWHFATIVLQRNAELSFFLDGVTRESPKLTNANPEADYLYRLPVGTLRLGYFKVCLNFMHGYKSQTYFFYFNANFMGGGGL